MAAPTANIEAMPVVRNLTDFDHKSGNQLERVIFNNRLVVMLACARRHARSLVPTRYASTLNASYEKMLPAGSSVHPNYLANKSQLRGLGNTLRVVVENTQGDIFDPAYLDTLKKINDELFLTPGVDRAWVKSLLDAGRALHRGDRGGLRGRAGDAGHLRWLRPERRAADAATCCAARLVGSLVANDFKSA